MSEKPVCPYCGSLTTFRSHRKLWERFIPVLRPFRCRACHSRFFAHEPSADEKDSARRVG